VSSLDVLLLSGAGRFADPWHPFPETSAALAAALEARGGRVDVREDAEDALGSLADGALPGLLVVNLGWYGPDRLTEPATAGLVAALDAGVPVMLVHSTLTAFPDWSWWRQTVLGGGWVFGTSYHPDYAEGVAQARLGHPITAGLDRLAITDERYTALVVAEGSEVYLEHEEAGVRHPLAWTRRVGRSPVVADALGHDAGSYAAAGRRTLLERELDWLLTPAAP
jgi:hypothetical protein